MLRPARPPHAQALARHSTIDLTMNVYTHVGIDDLFRDVENLPALLGHAALCPPVRCLGLNSTALPAPPAPRIRAVLTLPRACR